ncbi:hypothetical protein H0H92_004970, partial [Tricholoma furcatifolium]
PRISNGDAEHTWDRKDITNKPVQVWKLSSAVQALYLQEIEKKAAGIKEAFARQQEAAKEPWDQRKFEELLVQWIVACDQPFDEVEKPEFLDMISYGRKAIPDFNIPKRDGVHRCVMKLGEDTVHEIRAIFDALDSKISLSLDAWTSSTVAFQTVWHVTGHRGPKIDEI